MKTRRFCQIVSCAALAVAAPLHAAAPVEIFEQLAQPVQVAPSVSENRASAVPALAYLPGNADAVLTLVNTGESPGLLTGLAGDPTSRAILSSIGSIALGADAGFAETLRAWMRMAICQSSSRDSSRMLALWKKNISSAAAAVVDEVLKNHREKADAEVVQNLQQWHMAPIYGVITMAPGKDEDFKMLYEILMSLMDVKTRSVVELESSTVCESVSTECETDAADDKESPEGDEVISDDDVDNEDEEDDDDDEEDEEDDEEMDEVVSMLDTLVNHRTAWEPCEWQGFTGIRSNMAELAVGSGFVVPPHILDILKQKNIHLLAKKQDGVILFVLCQNPEDIRLPENAEQSLLKSPALNGLDAHGNKLMLAAWAKPAVLQAVLPTKPDEYTDDLRMAEEVFTKMAEVDRPNEAAFKQAAEHTRSLCAMCAAPVQEVKKPFFLKVWGEGSSVKIECTADAMDMTFRPGMLRFGAALSDDTVLYAESTEPVWPERNIHTEGLVDDAFAVVKGYILTRDEATQDELSANMGFAELFRPDAEKLGGYLKQIVSGLDMPIALVVEAPNRPHSQLQVALCAGVRDRLALSAGWAGVLSVADTLGERFGLPGVSAMLPIVARPLSESTTSYMLVLPLMVGMEPQVAVNDKSFVLSSSTELNSKLADVPADGVPFCGAVIMLQKAPMAKYLSRVCGPEYARLLRGNAKLYIVYTVQDGTMVGRGLMEYNSSPAAAAQ